MRTGLQRNCPTPAPARARPVASPSLVENQVARMVVAGMYMMPNPRPVRAPVTR